MILELCFHILIFNYMYLKYSPMSDHVRHQLIQEDAKVCQISPNVNIPKTEKTTLVWTYEEKRRRQPLKKNDGHGRTGEEKKGRPRRRWIDNNREDEQIRTDS